MKLKTLDESLHEAQGGDIDFSIGYSILRDLYKRSNFDIKSASYVGKSKVKFMYLDKESKNPEVEKKVIIEFSVEEMDEKSTKNPTVIKNPNLSFTSNKYLKFIRIMVDKISNSKRKDTDAGGIAITLEKQIVGKSVQYEYLTHVYNKVTGEFTESKKIKILVTK